MIDLYDLVLLIPLVTRQNRVGENVLNVWIVGTAPKTAASNWPSSSIFNMSEPSCNLWALGDQSIALHQRLQR
jgi:hypothetical protein